MLTLLTLIKFKIDEKLLTSLPSHTPKLYSPIIPGWIGKSFLSVLAKSFAPCSKYKLISLFKYIDVTKYVPLGK